LKTKKAVRLPLSSPKYAASGLNFSMKAEIAFCRAPDFSASLPCVDVSAQHHTHAFPRTESHPGKAFVLTAKGVEFLGERGAGLNEA
jgi:hypothetical protein